jgi:hypothetical protein
MKNRTTALLMLFLHKKGLEHPIFHVWGHFMEPLRSPPLCFAFPMIIQPQMIQNTLISAQISAFPHKWHIYTLGHFLDTSTSKTRHPALPWGTMTVWLVYDRPRVLD